MNAYLIPAQAGIQFHNFGPDLRRGDDDYTVREPRESKAF
jgi:hypothetical protein